MPLFFLWKKFYSFEVCVTQNIITEVSLRHRIWGFLGGRATIALHNNNKKGNIGGRFKAFLLFFLPRVLLLLDPYLCVREVPPTPQPTQLQPNLDVLVGG